MGMFVIIEYHCILFVPMHMGRGESGRFGVG